MKRTFDQPAFSIAMSEQTGCLVMVRTTGEKVKVIGSLTREQSQMLADRIRAWRAPTVLDAQLAVN